jgi:predicted CXXCH cytochrome family protein
MFADAAETEQLGSAEQLRDILSLRLRPDQLEILLQDNCILCHSNPKQNEEFLFSLAPAARGAPAHLNLRQLVSDVHFRRGLSCAGCHGGQPTDAEMSDPIYERWPPQDERHTDRRWIPEFCARCHGDPAFMRRFNPALPTDQLAKYRESRHGHVLLEDGDSRAAQCVSCHGVHGIRGAKSPLSPVHPQRIPDTCGACHADAEVMAGFTLPDGQPLPTNQLEEFRTSVHGKALLQRGDTGAPACNDCHGNHAAIPPDVASVAQICRTCHSANGTLFDGSKHKQAFERHRWPECGQCHGKHAIAKTDDSMVGATEGTMCYACHRDHAGDNAECNATADHFHASLTSLAAETDRYAALAHTLAKKGLDTEPLGATLIELQDGVRQLRSAIHAFDRSEFDRIAAPVQAAAEGAARQVEAADEEHRFRRRGLLFAIGSMVFLGIVLYAKIRQLERR